MSEKFNDDYEVRITRRLEDGAVLREQWRRDGLLHDPPHGAADKIFDPDTGVVHIESHYSNGVEHRSNGPAGIVRDNKTGHTISEDWIVFGAPRTSAEGPATTLYDGKTGIRIKEIYREGETIHRDGAPAIIQFDRHTGEIVRERFVSFGEEEITDEPSYDHPSLDR